MPSISLQWVANLISNIRPYFFPKKQKFVIILWISLKIFESNNSGWYIWGCFRFRTGKHWFLACLICDGDQHFSGTKDFQWRWIFFSQRGCSIVLFQINTFSHSNCTYFFNPEFKFSSQIDILKSTNGSFFPRFCCNFVTHFTNYSDPSSIQLPRDPVDFHNFYFFQEKISESELFSWFDFIFSGFLGNLHTFLRHFSNFFVHFEATNSENLADFVHDNCPKRANFFSEKTKTTSGFQIIFSRRNFENFYPFCLNKLRNLTEFTDF